MRQRQIAGDRAKAEAETVQRAAQQRVLARKCAGPQGGVVSLRGCHAIHRGQRFGKGAQARAGYHPFYRNAAEARAQVGEQAFLHLVQRSEVDMAAFGRHHLAALGQQQRNAKPGARPDDSAGPVPREGLVRPGDMAQVILLHGAHGMPDGREIIEENRVLQRQIAANLVEPETPRAVGHLHAPAAQRTGNRKRGGRRKLSADPGRESPEGGGQTGEIRGRQLYRFAKRDVACPAGGEGKAGMGAADIGDDDLSRFAHSPASASIALPPFSAGSL